MLIGSLLSHLFSHVYIFLCFQFYYHNMFTMAHQLIKHLRHYVADEPVLPILKPHALSFGYEVE